MGAWDFTKIKTYLIGAGALWALLAFVAWHYESTCGMFLSGACWATYWDGLRHVLLLKWVWDFQTLAAGVLAFAAGAFAFAAATLKIKHGELAEFNRRRLEQSQACSILAADFLLASAILKQHKSDPNLLKRSAILRPPPHPQANKIYELNRILGTRLTAIHELAYESANLRDKVRRIISTECLMMAEILQRASKEVYITGIFRMLPSSIPASQALLATITELELAVSDLNVLGPYMIWNPGSE
jgi:hypothetical protein